MGRTAGPGLPCREHIGTLGWTIAGQSEPWLVSSVGTNVKNMIGLQARYTWLVWLVYSHRYAWLDYE